MSDFTERATRYLESVGVEGTRLRFSVYVDSERPMNGAEWSRIAKRIEKAAKGRSKLRSVSIGPGRI
jgi:hypothetical protein